MATAGGESLPRPIALAALLLPLLPIACAHLESSAPRPIDRLCGADAGCRAAVARAPELTYPHLDQAVSAGLAWAHEQPQARAPAWREIGVAVYPAEGGYRIEVTEGDAEHVRVQLRAGAVAAAHTHPLPLLRRCSAGDREAASQTTAAVYVQHVRGEVERCTPLRVAGR